MSIQHTTESPLPTLDAALDVEMETAPKVDPTALYYLIVEHRRFDRNMIKSAMRTHHLGNIVEADDAAEAFKIIRSPHDKVDFILVSQDLPILSGYDFTRLVRRGVDIPNPQLPIIMIADVAAERVVAEARAAGVHELIAKPFSPDGPFSRIQRTLNHPRPLVHSKTFVGPAPPTAAS